MNGELMEMHCTPKTCYGVDIDGTRVVQLDPYTGMVKTVMHYSPSWTGIQEFSSALDRNGLVMYQTLEDSDGKPRVVAFDLRKHTLTVINSSVIGTDGPLCFDATFGLLSLGSSHGGVVAYEPSSGATRVLRKDALIGIPGERTFDCRNGLVVLSVVDFIAPKSPMLLLAFDFRTSDRPFHNSTVVDIHALYFAE